MQYITMPFAKTMMLVGYKVAPYRAQAGYDHYGVDLTGQDKNVLASGSGTVLAAGRDNKVGNVLAILYPGAVNHKTGVHCDMIARYYHLASLAVKKGEEVRRGQLLGVEGETGTPGGVHLHLEFDKDTAYPCYSPQVAGGNIIFKGIDSTVNPSDLLVVGKGQEIMPPKFNPEWLTAADQRIPAAPVEDELREENKRLRKAIDEYEREKIGVINKLREIAKEMEG